MIPEIKTATLEHLEIVVSLFDAYRVFYQEISDLERARTFLLERIQNAESVIYIAFDGEKPLGFTQLYPCFSSASTQKLWILNDLYVIPEARGLRVGEHLIERAMQLARDTSAKGVMLETAHTNLSGQKLYERMGFEREDLEFRTYFKSV
jgi:ribosomal protein S18 acetylase RimI-like enzyme